MAMQSNIDPEPTSNCNGLSCFLLAHVWPNKTQCCACWFGLKQKKYYIGSAANRKYISIHVTNNAQNTNSAIRQKTNKPRLLVVLRTLFVSLPYIWNCGDLTKMHKTAIKLHCSFGFALNIEMAAHIMTFTTSIWVHYHDAWLLLLYIWKECNSLEPHCNC